ncbi:MAG: phage holin family protein [Paucibacter sp.]|nr:phage holin family protein [Roseateles sp.]
MCLHLLAPMVAQAQAIAVKSPLDLPMKSWLFFGTFAILGGFVNWLSRVKRGEAQASNVSQLIGELVTSGMAGLMAWMVMQWLHIDEMLQAPIVGVAGHMGATALQWAEFALKKRAEAILGIPPQSKDDL